jgi:hypothetical protein
MGSHLGGDGSYPYRSKAALLEFLATAAGTWTISPDTLERILNALAAASISFSLPSPPLLVHAVLLAKAVLSGQFFYGIAE